MGMASTQHRSIRIPDDIWLQAMTVAKERDTSAGELCRQFLEWYLRRPGVQLPKRPSVGITWQHNVPIVDALWDVLSAAETRELLGLSQQAWTYVVAAVIELRKARGLKAPYYRDGA